MGDGCERSGDDLSDAASVSPKVIVVGGSVTLTGSPVLAAGKLVEDHSLRSEAVWTKAGNGDTSGRDAQDEVDDDIGCFVAAAMSGGSACHEEEEPGCGCGHQYGGYSQ